MNGHETIDRLLREAFYLRDFLLRFGSPENEPLIAALAPFEREEAAPPTPDEVRALFAAFQRAHHDAKLRLDPHTLSEVLRGRSPYRIGRPLGTSLGMAAIGAVLFFFVFHFSNWAAEASFTLAQAERTLEFPHEQELMGVVELHEMFDTLDPAPDDLEPYRLYTEALARLQTHYYLESDLPGEMSRQIGQSRIRTAACGFLPTEMQSVVGRVCPSTSQATPLGVEVTRSASRPSLDLPAIGDAADFRSRQQYYDALINATMVEAQRSQQFLDQPGIARQTIVEYAATLESRLKIVHRWTLPIIYGMLGSIIYCLWTVLHPDRAAHTLMYTLLRTAFAGVAAMTLSMLLIPSNTLTIGVNVSQPFIYLLCFVFGYSIEAFINTLNSLNQYVTSSVTPKEPPARRGAEG